MNSAREAQLRSWDLVREAQGLPSLAVSVAAKEVSPLVTDIEKEIDYLNSEIKLCTKDEIQKTIYLEGRIEGLFWVKNHLNGRPSKPRRISPPRR